MDNFDRNRKELDKQFGSIFKLSTVFIVFNMFIVIAMIGGGAYVVYLLLRYFGII